MGKVSFIKLNGVKNKLKKFFNNPKQYFYDGLQRFLNKRFSNAYKNCNKPALYLYHFSYWKRDFLQDWYPNNSLEFLPFYLSEKKFLRVFASKILKDSGDGFLIWGMNAPDYLLKFLLENNIPYYYVEDGFLRSKKLGIEYVAPASLIFDRTTLYFDATKESDLEKMLLSYDFKEDTQLLKASRALIDFLIEKGVSKYNQGINSGVDLIYGEKSQKRVLVLGQVEHDASIKYGCIEPITNQQLLEVAITENPNAQIIYKPHPDVLKKNKQFSSGSLANNITILTENIALSEAFKTIDHVYTITSLSGLEALMRDIKVTTLGCPFYSGWGLTDDRQINDRRDRQLSIEELVAVAYILYPKYFHPYMKEYTTAEKIAHFLYSC
ncbi:capsular polysaccharide biosynthesis protein [Ignatzschineria sp. RMDPL8A]|uniref:capsular polysaccharide export protein, LipB/KpsS family n=1 Tax=Ignatzschineria sp. RMDPL8A TaxID=2999236 RepID=UPI0024467BD2|nr:hypothetical protein [Ignatzschineria sp. RMDPL8A]MDG9730414.1 capsular polysaccharide biosynthesis protein [Ignatzschineria sp. RMDPL8A]